ncbi:uncharacterized protein LOC144427177 [Styela clava]
MAEVCTKLSKDERLDVSIIKTSPLNLSMLSKKRAIESLMNSETIQDGVIKRPRRENDITDDEEKQENEQQSDEVEENEDDEKSKTSILKHFYSFIRRKADQNGIDGRPNTEALNQGDEDQKFPTEAYKPQPETFERLRSLYNLQATINNGNVSPTLLDKNMYALEYNAAMSRQLAARANTNNLMDVWSAMAANAIARAKNNEVSDIQRRSPTFATATGLNGNAQNGNEYETKLSTSNIYATSPASTNAIPERTMRQNNWAVKVWRDWAIERNSNANLTGKTGPLQIVPMDIKDATVDVMSYWLPKFITEVRRRDKRAYPPDTLMQIASGLQRHLRHVSGRSDITFFDKYSPTFAEFREALKARSDAINSQISTIRRSGIDQESSPENNDLGSESWPSSLFNLNSAKGLFRAIFYHTCLSFHITSMEEHHSLLVSQFRIGFDEITKQEYLEFTRENGQITRKMSALFDERCIVKVFKKYFQHIPSNGLLYKRPLQSSDSSELRFSFNPVGINKLRETFKMLFGGRRSGAHLPSMEEDDDREGMQHSLRLYSGEDDPRSILKFEHSPNSNASSGQGSCLEMARQYSNDNRRPSDGSAQEQLSPTRSVINYATDNKILPIPSPSLSTTLQQRPKMMEENSNNNASTIDEDDSLTLKLPAHIQSVIIFQGNKKFKVDLTAIN